MAAGIRPASRCAADLLPGGRGSFAYLATSAMLWIISGDVVRYRPLVIFTGFVCVIGGPVLWWVGTRAGMPSWWVLMDALSCLVGGSVLLWASGLQKNGTRNHG